MNTKIKYLAIIILFVQFSLFLGAQEQSPKEGLPATDGLLLDLGADTIN